MIYWDLDGVLREFGTYILGYEPNRWDATRDGKTVIQIVNENPEICMKCPPTKYLQIVNEYMDKIIVLSNQLPSWIPFTNKWLNNNIEISYEVKYTRNAGQKLSLLKKCDILVEDFPNYSDYSQIALIDYAYNRHLDVPVRISTTKDLERFLLSFEDMYERVI